MPTYKGTQNLRAQHNSAAWGNAWIDSNAVAVPAAITTADRVVAIEVPAGTRLDTMRFRGGDFDTGATLVVNIGYRTKLVSGGSATNLTYFATASAALQAATATWQELVFNPITFDEPVEVVFTPTAGAAGQTGSQTLFVQATGAVVGIASGSGVY
jgi:hypothetical protein